MTANYNMLFQGGPARGAMGGIKDALAIMGAKQQLEAGKDAVTQRKMKAETEAKSKRIMESYLASPSQEGIEKLLAADPARYESLMKDRTRVRKEDFEKARRSYLPIMAAQKTGNFDVAKEQTKATIDAMKATEGSNPQVIKFLEGQYDMMDKGAGVAAKEWMLLEIGLKDPEAVGKIYGLSEDTKLTGAQAALAQSQADMSERETSVKEDEVKVKLEEAKANNDEAKAKVLTKQLAILQEKGRAQKALAERGGFEDDASYKEYTNTLDSMKGVTETTAKLDSLLTKSIGIGVGGAPQALTMKIEEYFTGSSDPDKMVFKMAASQLALAEGLKERAPGSTTENEMARYLETVPNVNATDKVWQSWLGGLKDKQDQLYGRENIRSSYYDKNKSRGSARRDFTINVNGHPIKFKAGEKVENKLRSIKNYSKFAPKFAGSETTPPPDATIRTYDPKTKTFK